MQIYLTILRKHPQFRYLWLAQVISLTGDWFNLIATAILVNRYTDSGTAIGGLFLARALPPFLFGPIAGVVADRFSRKQVIIATNFFRFFIVLGFLLVNSAADVWLIYVLTISQFVVSAFFEPAYAAILPSLVEADDLLHANTLSSITWSAMLTLGAAIGGVTVAVFGVTVALIIDALTFALAALIMTWIIVPPDHEQSQTAHSSGWTNFMDGLRYVRQNPNIGLITLVKGMGQIGSVDVIVTFYAEKVFPEGKEGAITLGLLLAMHGIGAILAPLITNWLGDGSSRMLHRAIIVGFMMIPVGWLVLGIAPNLPIAMLGSLLRGMGGSINWTYSSVLLQMHVPDRLLGRVFGLDFTIFTLALSLSVWGMGTAYDQFGIAPRDLAIGIAILSILPLIGWIIAARQPAGLGASLQVVEEN